MAKRVKDGVVATLTIHKAGEMDKKGRDKVATWIVEQAVYFLNHAPELSKRFTARYRY